MLRVSLLWRGVSPFTLFLMDQKNNPALKGCAISKRGRILSKMYKELSQNQRRELKQRAARHPTLPKQTRKQREEAASLARSRRKGKFAKFVRENYHKVKKLNYRKRFGALSQLYDVSKPLDVEKEISKALPKSKSKAQTKKKVKATVKSMAAEEKKTTSASKRAKSTSGRKKIKSVAKKITRSKV
ncbi:putative kinetoplast DNA-associated protein [Trypanosoma cruzi]|uniref:Kinetoplast DNA-associated protein, putative n=2 Tax=Trypanosoma cruzi TaxID=5693 RepID=Q4DNI4_TRYCC|nr:kinetoplast DNA-associated protein, putative [Trypanosoma cruzi]EAN94091.1 kinetoplast DNA-associated protein, putative [Trypanosoma cruzi]PWV17144.1 putative kinetoplast DNA-associated protein [Trypanosoma cruzi]|eukprot:XP_815942.1 kinetoplast DNA-associated protein [Trypanosoma cruzi strain CL Brener]